MERKEFTTKVAVSKTAAAMFRMYSLFRLLWLLLEDWPIGELQFARN